MLDLYENYPPRIIPIDALNNLLNRVRSISTSNELPNTRGFRFLLFSIRERSTPPITPEIPADFDIIIIRGALLGIGTLHGSPVSRNQTFLVVLLGNDRGDRSIDPIWKHRGENSFGLLGLEFNLFS